MDVEGDLLDMALLQPREVQDADMKSPNKSATAEVQLLILKQLRLWGTKGIESWQPISGWKEEMKIDLV